jgi:hypothetical protein
MKYQRRVRWRALTETAAESGGNFSKSTGFDDGRQDKCCRKSAKACWWFYGADAEIDCKAALAGDKLSCVACSPGPNQTTLGCPAWQQPAQATREQEQEQESSCIIDQHVDALAVSDSTSTSGSDSSRSSSDDNDSGGMTNGPPSKLVVLVSRWSDGRSGSSAPSSTALKIVAHTLVSKVMPIGDVASRIDTCWAATLETLQPSLREGVLDPPAVQQLPSVCANATTGELEIAGLNITSNQVLRLTLALHREKGAR